eukprot:s527_g14.t1
MLDYLYVSAMILTDQDDALWHVDAAALIFLRQLKAKLNLKRSLAERTDGLTRTIMTREDTETLKKTLRCSNRGLALMAALTSWPTFNMQQLLQPQVLRLEEAIEEARKAGSVLPDQLQQAILLKCVGGQLRT